MINTRTILGLAAAALLASGCASDPNKNLKTAQAEEAEETREHREDRADKQKEASLDRAEERKDRADDRADKMTSGVGNRVEAEAAMTATREKYRARATARLEKAQAKLQEARRKVDIAAAKAPTDVRARIDTATTQHASVASEVQSLSRVSDDQWQGSTESIDKHLDELDKLVGEATDRANALKH